VVFWCSHSSRSAEVQWECKQALKCKKNVLPVLLDATPLPPGLRAYQWIDFQAAFEDRHGPDREEARMMEEPWEERKKEAKQAFPRSYGRLPALILVFFAMFLGLLVVAITIMNGLTFGDIFLSKWVYLSIILLTSGIILFRWVWRRRKVVKDLLGGLPRRKVIIEPEPSIPDKLISKILLTEIKRRLD
jgi:hypothetical protein